jgi:ketosteroid isomerase-like protein
MTPATIAPETTAAVSADVLTVRSFFRAWAAGDVSRLDTLVDADVALEPVAGLLYERESYRGRSGAAHAFRETGARWERLELTLEFAEADGDQVLAVVRVVQAKHGMTSDARITVVCAMRDGLIAAVTDDLD